MTDNYGIYLVTDTAQCGGSHGVVETAQQAVAGGVRTIQVRDKTRSAQEFLALVLAVAAAVGERAMVLVNDRVDVYLAARTRTNAVHGVHVGQDDLPPAVVRALIGPDAVLGLTANTQAHFDAIATLPIGVIDYLGVGAIHATATKLDHPDALGIAGFTRLVEMAPLPCVAIGGISVEDVAALRRGGAAGAAIVSAICGTDDPVASTRALVAQWLGAGT